MGRKSIDIKNQRFGKLTVLQQAGSDKRYGALWLCRCDCGNEIKVQARLLKRGKVTTCGCFKHYNTAPKRTKTYITWQKMKDRCFNPNSCKYQDYGARGISVCKRWRNDFFAFLSDMGKCPSNMTLGRLDNNKDYFPGNCRWESKKKQSLNRRSTVWLEYNGIKLCQEDWSRLLGISRATIQRHRQKGETVGDIIRYFGFKPVHLNAPYTHPGTPNKKRELAKSWLTP